MSATCQVLVFKDSARAAWIAASPFFAPLRALMMPAYVLSKTSGEWPSWWAT